MAKKRIALFGAGQYGQHLFRLLDKERYTIAGFIDNGKSGETLLGLPVFAPGELAALRLDAVMLALKGDDRREKITAQLRDLAPGLRIETPPADCIDIRAAEFSLLARQLNAAAVPGAAAELGVYRGDFAALLVQEFPGRRVFLVDTFEGFSPKDIDKADGAVSLSAFRDVSFEEVRARFAAHGNVKIIKGHFAPDAAEIIDELRNEQFCFVSIDADLYRPVYEGLCFFYPRLNRGGCILAHDAGGSQYPGAGKALEQFCREQKIFPFPLCDLHGSAVLIKNHD
jgi:O-methyltransferase